MKNLIGRGSTPLCFTGFPFVLYKLRQGQRLQDVRGPRRISSAEHVKPNPGVFCTVADTAPGPLPPVGRGVAGESPTRCKPNPAGSFICNNWSKRLLTNNWQLIHRQTHGFLNNRRYRRNRPAAMQCVLHIGHNDTRCCINAHDDDDHVRADAISCFCLFVF